MSALPFAARRFDGRTAAGEPAFVRVVDGVVEVLGADDGSLRERAPLARATVAEMFEHAPVMLSFDNGATVEVSDDVGTFRAALADAGLRPTPVVRLQAHWPAVVAAVVLLVALSAWAYVSGIPVVAGWAAEAVSPALERKLGERVLAVMDEVYVEPTGLDRETRARIAARFADYARRSAPDADVRIEFRAGDPNAFALPGGIIVLLDGLVVFAHDDDAVIGVLGHELGHVVHRHATRQLFQATGAVALAGLLWGDLSTVAANASTMFGLLRYSRDFEREADGYALDFLRDNGVAVEPLYGLFARLQQHAKRHRPGELGEFLSTHPSTDERLQAMEREIVRRGGTPPTKPKTKTEGGS